MLFLGCFCAVFYCWMGIDGWRYYSWTYYYCCCRFFIGAAKCYCNVRSIRRKKDCAATFFLSSSSSDWSPTYFRRFFFLLNPFKLLSLCSWEGDIIHIGCSAHTHCILSAETLCGLSREKEREREFELSVFKLQRGFARIEEGIRWCCHWISLSFWVRHISKCAAIIVEQRFLCALLGKRQNSAFCILYFLDVVVVLVVVRLVCSVV